MISKKQTTKKQEDTRDHRGRTNNIVHNNWNGVDFGENDIQSFSINNISDTFGDTDMPDPEIVDFIHQTVETNNRTKHFNFTKSVTRASGNTTIKNHHMKKKDINLLFSLLLTNNKYKIYDLFEGVSYYFTITKFRLFDQLSNIYKKDILTYLQTIGGTSFKLY